MHHPRSSYLRPLCRRWGFTQEGLAVLIGVRRTTVARIEGSKRRPSVDAVSICALVFKMSSLSEDARMGIFDAAALGLKFFYSIDRRDRQVT
ncbi:helix-turn-helix transcriptional regulator [Bradyrhizobium sp. 26S5]|uniref:helix-turn-helix transcriptional regulator n=1 Tax=Bradyrhizobium sp. 26S5 TaxID=3139729 RepID=UPI0039C85739